MPLVSHSDYKAPFYLFNRHLETIVPSMFRKIDGVVYSRERIELIDGDFLDLDWLKGNSKKLMIFSHGLEGNSGRHYSQGMARYFFERGWDSLVWNCRGCSGEMNRLPRFYHHGATEDLQAVVNHVVEKNQYGTIVLTGVSMGGSMTLKYLGENKDQLPKAVKGAATFSVPCHLPSSAKALDQAAQKLYRMRFLKKLRVKIKWKSDKFPDIISFKDYDKIRLFSEFDNAYTAPLHGYKNADDFYDRASPMTFIPKITVPTLIANALNDPLLPAPCFPYDLLKTHPTVYLEFPAQGGHTGFSLAGAMENWMEVRSFDFLKNF